MTGEKLVADIRPGTAFAGIGLIFGQALVDLAQVPVGQGERIGFGGDLGPELLHEFQFQGERGIADLGDVGEFHGKKIVGLRRNVKWFLPSRALRDDVAGGRVIARRARDLGLQPFAVDIVGTGGKRSDV